MQNYQYLTDSHDLSLPDWEPYARNYFGSSPLADKWSGTRFDYLMILGIYRRERFFHGTLAENMFSPWDVSGDLNFYSYCQQIKAKNKVFVDISDSRINDHFRLTRCEFVNRTDKKNITVLHFFAGIFSRYEGELRLRLFAGSCWIAATDHETLDFAIPHYDDKLTWDSHCVTGAGFYRAVYNGIDCNVRQVIPGTLEIDIHQNSRGKFTLTSNSSLIREFTMSTGPPKVFFMV